MNWEIEEDIPMNVSKTTKIKNLKVGESFVVDTFDEVRVLRTLFNRVNRRCSIKKQKEGNYRCWCVE